MRVCTFVSVLLAMATPAFAQPSTSPAESPPAPPSDAVPPTAVPAATVEPPATTEPPATSEPRATGEATPPPAPPAPPPPRFTGLLPSSATDQRLFTHSHALDLETEVPDHPFTGFLFADYWFLNGPRIGGSAGMFRAFEIHLGALLDTKTTMGATPMDPSTTSSSTRIFYGASVGLLSIRGISLSGGLTFLTGDGDTSAAVPTGTLSIPLYAHWLPFRVAKTRVRITYPAGVGIEWGVL